MNTLVPSKDGGSGDGSVSCCVFVQASYKRNQAQRGTVSPVQMSAHF
jgi:hypothetical protein